LSCGSKLSFGGGIDGFGGCEKREVEDDAVNANPLLFKGDFVGVAKMLVLPLFRKAIGLRPNKVLLFLPTTHWTNEG